MKCKLEDLRKGINLGLESINQEMEKDNPDFEVIGKTKEIVLDLFGEYNNIIGGIKVEKLVKEQLNSA